MQAVGYKQILPIDVLFTTTILYVNRFFTQVIGSKQDFTQLLQ